MIAQHRRSEIHLQPVESEGQIVAFDRDVQEQWHGPLFVNNQTNGTNEGLGGAIANAGTLAVSDSQFISNFAIGSGLGANASGGAVQNGQTMTITNCLFTGNNAMGGRCPTP